MHRLERRAGATRFERVVTRCDSEVVFLLWLGQTIDVLFFYFFFIQIYRLYATLRVMTDYSYLYVHALAWLYALFCPFMLYLAAIFALTATFSLPPTPVAFKNLSSGPTALLFPSKLANHLLSPWACHAIPSFSSSLTSFLRSFLHFRHLVYTCSTDCTVSLHHQHSGVSITPIFARYVPTAPCPTLSW